MDNRNNWFQDISQRKTTSGLFNTNNKQTIDKLYQAYVVKKEKVKIGLFKTEEVLTPYPSTLIFFEEKSAEKYCGEFVKELIRGGFIDPSSIKEDGTLDEDKVITYMIPLQIGVIGVETEEDRINDKKNLQE